MDGRMDGGKDGRKDGGVDGWWPLDGRLLDGIKHF